MATLSGLAMRNGRNQHSGTNQGFLGFGFRVWRVSDFVLGKAKGPPRCHPPQGSFNAVGREIRLAEIGYDVEIICVAARSKPGP